MKTVSVFAKRVWLGGRRNAAEEIRGESQSEEKEQKHGTKVNLVLEGPLAAARVKAGGRHARGKSSGAERDATAKTSLTSLHPVSGDELRSQKFNEDVWLESLRSYQNWKAIKVSQECLFPRSVRY